MGKKKRNIEKSNDNKIVGFIIATAVIVVFFIFIGTMIGPSSPGIGPGTDNSNGEAEELDYSTYNNRSFEQRENLWYTTLGLAGGDAIYRFYTHPYDLEDIPFNDTSTLALAIVQQNQGTFAISLDSSISEAGIDNQYSTVAIVNMVRFAAPHFGLQVELGSDNVSTIDEFDLDQTNNEITEENVTVDRISCADANNQTAVISIRMGEEKRVDQDNFCTIFYVTEGQDIIDLADLYSYKVLGVM